MNARPLRNASTNRDHFFDDARDSATKQCLRWLVCSAMAVAAACVVTGALAQTRYTATRVPDPGGNLSTSARRINAAGVILGHTWFWDDEAVTSFTYDARLVTDLGAVAGAGINDRGQIAGMYVPIGSSTNHAFLMTGGSILDLHPSGANQSGASGINAAGDVAGWYTHHAGGPSRGFAFIDGAFVDIVPSAGIDFASASAINASGVVAGLIRYANGKPSHAFRWSNGQFEDLGTLGGSFSGATDINASGDVVGYAHVAGDTTSRAFLYTDGRMRDLGTPAGGDSFAYGINAARQVVGQYHAPDGYRAFVYDGEVRDLTALVVGGLDGAVIYRANAINDAGQIAADACASDACFGLRLDPIPVSSGRVVEYHHAEFDHYFATANAGEIAKLDSGAIAGWSRTGETFGVSPGSTAGAAPVCRFFSTSFAPKSSHFYTAWAEECAFVKRDLSRDWHFEGNVFFVVIPDDAGTCPVGTNPIYRIYNDGRGGAPNHRYTTSLTIRGQMIAAGWIPEGQGVLGVAMCAMS